MRGCSLLALLSVLVACPCRTATAGGGPENVALVVNPNDADSLAVANAYIELRRIPAVNVFYIPWIAAAAKTPAAMFREKLLKPLLEQIKERGIAGQIDCVTFSTGYPYVVDCTALFADKGLPQQGSPMLSLSSAMFLHQFLLTNRAEMFQPNANLYFAPAADGQVQTQAFMGAMPWSSSGTAAPKEGRAYLLATSLGVTTGRGNTADELVAALKRSRQADGTKPKGTVYFMQNNNVRSQVRQGTFAAAAKQLTALGVKAEVRNGVVPNGRADIIGLTTGATNVEPRAAGSKFLPGALVDNLTSSGAQFVIPKRIANPQTPVSEYLRQGAAGASGTVIEPFAIPAKFPAAELHVHYARGVSLAEAFYLSVAWPCHLLVVGDPLCQPFATAPAVSVEGATDGGAISGEVELKPVAKYPDGRAASRFDVFINGKRRHSVAPGGTYRLPSPQLADGWHELRVVAVDNTPIAVQGEWVAAVQVKNRAESLELSALGAARGPLTSTFAVEANSSLPEDVTVLHNGRSLGTIAGGKGRFEVPARLLGRGRVQLIARQAGAKPLQSKAVTLEVF